MNRIIWQHNIKFYKRLMITRKTWDSSLKLVHDNFVTWCWECCTRAGSWRQNMKLGDFESSRISCAYRQRGQKNCRGNLPVYESYAVFLSLSYLAFLSIWLQWPHCRYFAKEHNVWPSNGVTLRAWTCHRLRICCQSFIISSGLDHVDCIVPFVVSSLQIGSILQLPGQEALAAIA